MRIFSLMRYGLNSTRFHENVKLNQGSQCLPIQSDTGIKYSFRAQDWAIFSI